MITVLKNKKLGVNEIQQFELGLRYNQKSERMQEKSEKPLLRVIQAAMEVKRRDEIHRNKELKIQREEKKRRRNGWQGYTTPRQNPTRR